MSKTMTKCESCAAEGRAHNVPAEGPNLDHAPAEWPTGWCVPCADAGGYHFADDCPNKGD